MAQITRANSVLKGKVVIQGLIFDWVCANGDLEVSHARYGRRVLSLQRFTPHVLARLVAIGMVAEPVAERS